MTSCPELITLLGSGAAIRFRRRSAAYLRLTNTSLTAVGLKGRAMTLWMRRRSPARRIIRSLPPGCVALLEQDWAEVLPFLAKWEEMRQIRAWPDVNFPELGEIAAFCYLTLVPDHWQIYTEENGEVLPLFEHEELHCDVLGDEAE